MWTCFQHFRDRQKHNERRVFDLPLFLLHLCHNLRCHHVMGKLSNEKDKYIAEVTPRQSQTLHSWDCLDVSFTGRRESLCLQWRGTRMTVTFQCVSLLVFVQGLTANCCLSKSLQNSEGIRLRPLTFIKPWMKYLTERLLDYGDSLG